MLRLLCQTLVHINVRKPDSQPHSVHRALVPPFVVRIVVNVQLLLFKQTIVLLFFFCMVLPFPVLTAAILLDVLPLSPYEGGHAPVGKVTSGIPSIDCSLISRKCISATDMVIET